MDAFSLSLTLPDNMFDFLASVLVGHPFTVQTSCYGLLSAEFVSGLFGAKKMDVSK